MWTARHYHALRAYCFANAAHLDEDYARTLGPPLPDPEWEALWKSNDVYFADPLRVPGWLRDMERDEEFTWAVVDGCILELSRENLRERDISPAVQASHEAKIKKLVGNMRFSAKDPPHVVNSKRETFKEQFRFIVSRKRRLAVRPPEVWVF